MQNTKTKTEEKIVVYYDDRHETFDEKSSGVFNKELELKEFTQEGRCIHTKYEYDVNSETLLNDLLRDFGKQYVFIAEPKLLDKFVYLLNGAINMKEYNKIVEIITMDNLE